MAWEGRTTPPTTETLAEIRIMARTYRPRWCGSSLVSAVGLRAVLIHDGGSGDGLVPKFSGRNVPNGDEPVPAPPKRDGNAMAVMIDDDPTRVSSAEFRIPLLLRSGRRGERQGDCEDRSLSKFTRNFDLAAGVLHD